MKTIIIVCNYNEEQTGNLKNCLLSLSKNKTKDTIIGVIDNSSIDNSVSLLNSYVISGVIDYCILSSRNLGKAKALNNLFKFIMMSESVTPGDLVIHLDSDICLYNNCVTRSNKLFTDYADLLLYSTELSYDCNNFVESTYHTFSRKTATKINIDNNQYLKLSDTQGICGCFLCMKIEYFMNVNLYNENLGYNNNTAIYGGDDAVLLLKLHQKYLNKFILIDESNWCYHPKTLDEKYQQWKIDTNSLMCKYGFGNNKLPNIGFYDK